MRRSFFSFDTFFATLFIFVAVWLLRLVMINSGFLDPFERAFRDFQYTDILYSKIRKEQQKIDTNIVLVNIGSLEQQGIAELISRVSDYHPVVVGVDISFRKKPGPESDSLFRLALSSAKNIVMAGVFNKYRDDTTNRFIKPRPSLGNYQVGHVLLTADQKRITVRSFHPVIINGNDTIEAFAVKMLKYLNINAYHKFMQRGNPSEIINFIGDYSSFRCFNPEDFLSGNPALEVIRNKAVIIGYFNLGNQAEYDFSDKFFTPLNAEIAGRSWPDMYGMVIHANILSMLARNDYMYAIPVFLELIISFIICFFLVGLFLLIHYNRMKFASELIKFLQICSSIFLLYLIFLFYEHCNITFDATIMIIGILLAGDLIFFYDGLAEVIRKKLEQKKKKTIPQKVIE